MKYSYIPSPLGDLLAGAENGALCGLWLPGQRYCPAEPAPMILWDGDELFTRLKKWLDAYFAGENPPPCLPLSPKGTPFRRKVWQALLNIPYGKTVTYGELARALSSSPRAVGGAVGHNPISVLIPCHRVIGQNNALTGYAGGLEAKEYLLSLEKRPGR